VDSTYTTEKNKIASAGAWITLLDIALSGYTTLRYTSDNTGPGTVWPTGGNVYTRMPFSVDDVHVSTSGAFPQYKLVIGELDPEGTLRTQIKASRGMVHGTVRLRVVHSSHLTVTTGAVDELAEILDCSVTLDAVVFTIGLPSLLDKRFPRDRYSADFCRHMYGGALCRYTLPGVNLASSQVRFEAGTDYHTIRVDDGGLLAFFDNTPGSRVCPGDLITNGNMEYGIKGGIWTGGGHIIGWDTWGGGAAKRDWVDNQHKYDTHCYYHIGSTTKSGISQTIDVVGGEQYTLSCWVKLASPPLTLRLMTLVGTTYYSDPAIATSGWQKLELTVTPTSANNGKMTVWIGGTGWAWFDAVCVVSGSTPDDYIQRQLSTNAGFTLSGSSINNGTMIANKDEEITDTFVRVCTDDVRANVFTDEAAGAAITLQLGYNECDHTLTACKLRNNAQNFGASPGMSGGVYG